MQTQTSNTLHNAIMEAGGKDRPPMLASGNSETTAERYIENYKNVSQDIRDKLNDEAEVVQIILTGIDNDIYFIVDAYLETNLYWEFGKFTSRDGESLESYYSRFYKMMNELVRNQCDVTNHQVNVQFLLQLQPEWQRSQQAATRNRGKAIVNSPPPIYDQEPSMVAEDDEIGTGYDNQRIVNVVGARENVGNVRNQNEQRNHKEKMLLYKQEEAGFQLNAEQADWRDDTDDEPDDQELEAHYTYMAQLQEVTPDAADNSGPIFDSKPLQKVPNNDIYNVFAIESEHHEQSKSVNDTYPVEQDAHNVINDSLDMSYNREQIDHDDDYDLTNECDLLASLIEKLKCKIDDRKNHNKFLETSNKALVDTQKGEIKDFKTKNKCLESSNTHFKEANNELSKTNQLMFKDLKKFQAELERYHDVKYASKVEIDCVYTELDEVTNLQCDYLETLEKCECLEKELSKSKMMSKSFEALQKHSINLELDLQQCKEKIKNDKSFKENQSKEFRKEREQYFEIQDLKAQLQDKGIAIRVIPSTIVSRPPLKSNQLADRVMLNNSQGKKQEVEDHRRNFKFSNNKSFVTACNDSLNAKTSNVNFVYVTCDKCVLNDNHEKFLYYLNGVNSRTKMPIAVPISTREPKRTVNQSVATPLRKTVASESTSQKPRHTTRKLYEH
nr:hypothetical protein [Tanacetum cinerariifolium]